VNDPASIVISRPATPAVVKMAVQLSILQEGAGAFRLVCERCGQTYYYSNTAVQQIHLAGQQYICQISRRASGTMQLPVKLCPCAHGEIRRSAPDLLVTLHCHCRLMFDRGHLAAGCRPIFFPLLIQVPAHSLGHHQPHPARQPWSEGPAVAHANAGPRQAHHRPRGEKRSIHMGVKESQSLG
jgi:hypothetical protein